MCPSLPQKFQLNPVVSLNSIDISLIVYICPVRIRTDLMEVDKWLLQPAPQHPSPLSSFTFIQESEERRVLRSGTLPRNGMNHEIVSVKPNLRFRCP